MKAEDRNLCVYCGASPGRTPAYMAAAAKLGRSLAEAGIGLVYGGGSHGLMGEVARSTLSAGGRVTGIIPQFLDARERMLPGVSEMIVTATMHERKMLMFERSIGFAALPGGIGTLEELSEIATWSQLDQHNKPLILCNVEGYWNPLLNLLRHMREEQFIREGMSPAIYVAESADEVVSIIMRRLQSAPENEREPPF